MWSGAGGEWRRVRAGGSGGGGLGPVPHERVCKRCVAVETLQSKGNDMNCFVWLVNAALICFFISVVPLNYVLVCL